MILCSRMIFPRANKQSITVFNIDTYTYQNKLPISVFFKCLPRLFVGLGLN